jgi:hypothetical protein
MLDYALAHKEELGKLLDTFNCDPKSFYFSPYSYLECTEVEKSTWSKLQLVALHAGQIQGYTIRAELDERPQEAVTK